MGNTANIGTAASCQATLVDGYSVLRGGTKKQTSMINNPASLANIGKATHVKVDVLCVSKKDASAKDARNPDGVVTIEKVFYADSKATSDQKATLFLKSIGIDWKP